MHTPVVLMLLMQLSAPGREGGGGRKRARDKNNLANNPHSAQSAAVARPLQEDGCGLVNVQLHQSPTGKCQSEPKFRVNVKTCRSCESREPLQSATFMPLVTMQPGQNNMDAAVAPMAILGKSSLQ